MPSPAPRLLFAGDSAIVVEFGDSIDPRVNARVRQLERALDASRHPGLIEFVPTYRSLMVHFDPVALPRAAVAELMLAAAGRIEEPAQATVRTVEIPVLYGGDEGPDLGDVAATAGLAERDVVEIHAGGEYTVFMIGFMPGFPYLGGLPPQIATPRLATPRTRVLAGSVGIAGSQTGIYPSESPGGWRLIGRTPVRLFDARKVPPALLEAGDRLRFVAVSQAEYHAIAREVDADRYHPNIRLGPGER